MNKVLVLGAAVFIASMFFAACGATPFLAVTIDGGEQEVDAGNASASTDGGIHLDAGLLSPEPDDAGYVDAGSQEPPDSGVADQHTCEQLVLPSTEEFACEFDSDYCDSADAPVANMDLLSTWSRSENGVFIVESRFRDFPFRGARMQAGVAFSWSDDEGSGRVCPNTPSGRVCGDVLFSLAAHSDDRPAPLFPPGMAFNGGETDDLHFPFGDTDLCSMLYVGLSHPMIKWEIPENEGIIAGETPYMVFAARLVADNIPWDYTQGDVNHFFIGSIGGMPDENIEYVSVCDLTCEAQMQWSNQ